MKLEIEVKYNIGDKVYYINQDYEVNSGKIKRIYINYPVSVVYELNNYFLTLPEDKLFSSKAECINHCPKLTYHIGDEVIVVKSGMLCKGTIYKLNYVKEHATYTIKTPDMYLYDVQKENIFTSFEEALKHF